MCWQGENKPKVAQADIPVTKVGIKDRDGVHPYFRENYTLLVYEEGKTFESNLETNNLSSNLLEIAKGLHGFNSDKIHIENYQYAYGLGENFTLSYSTNPDNKVYFRNTSSKYKILVVLLCSIPEGTIYYENEKGEIVTPKLRVDSIVDAISFCRKHETS